MKSLVAALILVVVSSVAWADLREDVKVGQLEVMKTVKERSTHYSLKVEVTNQGQKGDIYIDLVGKDASGFEVKRGVVKGLFHENETRTLTTTYTIPEPGQIIDSWEVAGFDKFLNE